MRIWFLFLMFVPCFLLCLYAIFSKLEAFDKRAYHQNFRHIYINDLEKFKNHGKENGIMAVRESDVTNSGANFVCALELFVTECPDAGFAAIFLQTVNNIRFCEKLGAAPTIFWRQCGTVCPKDPTINAWEMYFKPVNPNIVETAKVVMCLGGLQLQKSKIDKTALIWSGSSMNDIPNLSFRKRATTAGFEGKGIITRAVRTQTNQLIQKYVKVQPKIQKMVDQFYSRYMDKYHVVAVHVRGTDHGLETDDGRLVPLNAYIQNIKDFLHNKPTINRIFVASDNLESIKTFVKEFGSKVAYTKALRSKSYYGPPVHASGADAFKLGSQVLVDILLMAKCKYFFHVESSVAALVTYFNPSIESYFVDNAKILKPDFTSTKAKKKLRKEVSRNISLEEQEDVKDQADSFNCFLENRRFSVCPNFHKGKLVYLRDVLEMTHG